MKTIYPIITEKTDPREVLRKIARARIEEDLPAWNNLPNRFLGGRTTYRIPTHSSDVLTTDRIGDVTNDSGFQYVLVKYSTGVTKWNRIALSTSW